MIRQRLWGTAAPSPEELVRWFGAVQAQDYAGAKWGVGQRVRDGRDALLEDALQAGRILRTHVLRPTWHFVLPEDIRWLVTLSAPRVRAQLGTYDRKLAIDARTLGRSQEVIAAALEGGKQRTRTELGHALAQAGIDIEPGQRLGHLLMHAELSLLVCSGARRGKHATYALLDERAAATAVGLLPTREEALAALTLRYFQSHGPALVQDYAWWSGLTISDAKLGIASVARKLCSVKLEEQTYWSCASSPRATSRQPRVVLLPNFDEYVVAYRDHEPSFRPSVWQQARAQADVLSAHFVVLDGRVVGRFQRRISGATTREKASATLLLTLFCKLTAGELRALHESAKALARNWSMPVSVLPF